MQQFANAVASASVASSPASVFALALVSTLSCVDAVGLLLKAKLFSLGLSLIDNTHLHFPVAVSSVSSLSSKTPITNLTWCRRAYYMPVNITTLVRVHSQTYSGARVIDEIWVIKKQ